MTASSEISRRQWLLAVGSAPLAMGHDSFGPVKPSLMVPNTAVRWNDGTERGLAGVLSSHVTAVQWIFTTCRSTCPMQGAIFQRIQKLMPDHGNRGIQLLTLSVDPENDSPKALSEWLKRFHAAQGWLAGSPDLDNLERVRTFFSQSEKPVDNHSTQVFLVDRKGALIWRTDDLPEPAKVATMLEKIAA